MDRSRDAMQGNQANDDISHSAMKTASTSNQTIESLLGASMAALNASGHSFGINRNMVGTSLLDYANSQRRQQINPSLLAQSISMNLYGHLIGATGSQRNHAPLFPSEELVQIASLLHASSHHHSLSTLPGPSVGTVSGQQSTGMVQQQMAAILAGLRSKGETTRLDMNGVIALLRDLAAPTFDQRHTENISALSEVAPTSKHRRNIDPGESRTEYAPNANGTQFEDGPTSAGLDVLRGIFGHGTHHVLGALVDSTAGRISSVHDLDTARIDFETSSGKSEESTVGPAGRANGEPCHSSTSTTSSGHCPARRPTDVVLANQTSNRYEQKGEDQRYPTMASAKKSHVKIPDTNKNVEPTNPFLLPCRARGMPTDHNFRNAHFVIPGNVRHGEELICSYQECRNAGIKFQYCATCRIPVAKRNFNQRHSHGLYDMAVHESEANVVVPPLVPSSIVAGPKLHISSRDLYTRQKGTSAHSEDDDRATMDRMHHSETRDLKKHQRHCDVVESCHPRLLEPIPDISIDRQLRWISLLGSRPNIDDSDLLSEWLIEVMAVSDLQRALPPVLTDVSTSTPSALGERTSTFEGFGAFVSDTSSGAATSSRTSSVRAQDDPDEIDRPAKSKLVPSKVKKAGESGRKKKRRRMSKT